METLESLCYLLLLQFFDDFPNGFVEKGKVLIAEIRGVALERNVGNRL